MMRVLAVLLLAGCAPAPLPRRPPATTEPNETASTDAGAPKSPVIFDAALAKKRLDAVDISSCRALPPFADESLQVRVTFSPSGDATTVNVSEPFAATAFGDCLERLFSSVHVSAFDPPAQSMTTTLTRGAVKRDPTMSRFDAGAIRAAVQKANLAECGDVDRRSVIVSVKPSGQLESVTAEGDDARAKCVERVLRRIEFKPYAGTQGPSVTIEIGE